jgi:hypothetical protein
MAQVLAHVKESASLASALSGDTAIRVVEAAVAAIAAQHALGLPHESYVRHEVRLLHALTLVQPQLCARDDVVATLVGVLNIGSARCPNGDFIHAASAALNNIAIVPADNYAARHIVARQGGVQALVSALTRYLPEPAASATAGRRY